MSNFLLEKGHNRVTKIEQISAEIPESLCLQITEKFPEYQTQELKITKTNKNKIYQSYDKIYNWFHRKKSPELFEKTYLDLAISHLKLNIKILDIDCGMSEMLGKYFIDNGGEMLYYVSLSPDEYKKLLEKHNFEIIKYKLNNEAFSNACVWMSRCK